MCKYLFFFLLILCIVSCGSEKKYIKNSYYKKRFKESDSSGGVNWGLRIIQNRKRKCWYPYRLECNDAVFFKSQLDSIGLLKQFDLFTAFDGYKGFETFLLIRDKANNIDTIKHFRNNNINSSDLVQKSISETQSIRDAIIQIENSVEKGIFENYDYSGFSKFRYSNSNLFSIERYSAVDSIPYDSYLINSINGYAVSMYNRNKKDTLIALHHLELDHNNRLIKTKLKLTSNKYSAKDFDIELNWDDQNGICKIKMVSNEGKYIQRIISNQKLKFKGTIVLTKYYGWLNIRDIFFWRALIDGFVPMTFNL